MQAALAQVFRYDEIKADGTLKYNDRVRVFGCCLAAVPVRIVVSRRYGGGFIEPHW
ncbi:hypothetical protein GCM10023333_18590 [Ferrimonas pelagia]|uniref:Uncharacterized protein n=1 Tax=Ferrimonas pelagia TaxID=1177826 RepID=A0ABP9EXZ8_9GAMM